MNRTIKNILIVINVLMILISFKWYIDTKDNEPLISILGQFSALLVLLFEGMINSALKANRNVRTKIDMDLAKGDKVNTNDNEDSEVYIKTRD